ncbi:hypothetical protein OIU74_028281 [Salix koriyanagi]|uniref:Uncharacterized protein n=1 Tax=Salix koriyanagi TaxID=2511006 RepID=A0A9Q0VC94_9ROSI|nr:hypothetical protein OIU74_028281 [Salix koriyanagi]
MTEFEVRREKSTMLLVIEAWRANWNDKRGKWNSWYNKQNGNESSKRDWKNKYQLGKSVSKANRRVSEYSNILQNTSAGTSDQKGSPATLRKGRMVLRDDFQCMLMACHKNLSLSHSCKFGPSYSRLKI